MSERVAQGRIVLIGSGEIGPSMAPMHRALVASLPARSTPPSLVALDGSYDFQTNRAEMGEKIAVFFRSKVGVPTTVVGLPETERPGADLAPTAFSATLAALDAANILFLGPGSPSRALFRWAGTPIVDRLVSRIHAGATLITSSAAAAASGESAIPVYEIYKAGLPAHWLTGLNLVGTLLGVRVAIVPHWNNAEGATHDTSRCFIGDVKLRELERALPTGVAVLHGKGAVTIRIPGAGETAIHSGATESVSAFTARFPTSGAPRAYEPAAAAAPSASAPPLPAAPSPRDLLAPAVERLLTLRAEARAEKRFSDADAIRDAIVALGVELSDQADGVTWSVRAQRRIEAKQSESSA
jgi:pyruvate/2-oxoglutarate dehydrogenase complex dihydrolipoamide acyltransferase (E2) component